MANILSVEKQAVAIGALCEGNSIRSVERMTGIHRDTVMRLGVRVSVTWTAEGAAAMRSLAAILTYNQWGLEKKPAFEILLIWMQIGRLKPSGFEHTSDEATRINDAFIRSKKRFFDKHLPIVVAGLASGKK